MEFELLYALQSWHCPFLDALMVGLTRLGDKGVVWIVCAALLLLFRPTRPLGLAMALALLLTQLSANLILKPLIARARPCWLDPSVILLIPQPLDYSFPSGHSAASFAAALSLLFNRSRLALPALLLAAGIAFSRLYLFVHFPTDVLGGILLAVACAAFVQWLLQNSRHLRSSDLAAPDSEGKIQKEKNNS